MHTPLEPIKPGANIFMARLRRLRDHAHYEGGRNVLLQDFSSLCKVGNLGCVNCFFFNGFLHVQITFKRKYIWPLQHHYGRLDCNLATASYGKSSSIVRIPWLLHANLHKITGDPVSLSCYIELSIISARSECFLRSLCLRISLAKMCYFKLLLDTHFQDKCLENAYLVITF